MSRGTRSILLGIIIGFILPIIIFNITVMIIEYSGYIKIKDYIELQNDEDGNEYIKYNGETYYGFKQEGTRYIFASDISGTKVGNVMFGNAFISTAYMLEGTDNNIIFYSNTILLKSGYALPDMFEAGIGGIYYRKPHEKETTRTEILLTQDKINLDDIIDRQQCLTSAKGMKAKGIAYFYLSEIPGLQISMWVFELDSEIYLKYNKFVDDDYEEYYFLIKDEYKKLLSQMF